MILNIINLSLNFFCEFIYIHGDHHWNKTLNMYYGVNLINYTYSRCVDIFHFSKYNK